MADISVEMPTESYWVVVVSEKETGMSCVCTGSNWTQVVERAYRDAKAIIDFNNKSKDNDNRNNQH